MSESGDQDAGLKVGGVSKGKTRVRKHFYLDQQKIERARKVLGVKTETEAIERALDFVIIEYERNRLALDANDRFVHSGVHVQEIFGELN